MHRVLGINILLAVLSSVSRSGTTELILVVNVVLVW